jgi:hypothetical protein
MLNLKKTAVAVLALGSSAVFAGTMGPVCTPGNVTVPCESTAWDFGVQALYLEAVHNNVFGYESVSTVANTTHYNDFDNKWGWGFKLEGSYHFSTGNDLNVNWYHLENDHTRTGLAGFITPNGVVSQTVYDIDQEPQWDAVNVEFGQHVNFGEFKIIRFHGGVQFAQIKNELNAHIGTTSYNRLNNKFNGFGPRVGADMSYQLGNGLAMYANGATALLIGDSKFDYANLAVLPATYLYANGTRHNMVPELEAKLGLTYTYAMAQGNLSLDGGYMWVNYFSPTHALNLADNDFSLHGPYVGLKYVGNV